MRDHEPVVKFIQNFYESDQQVLRNLYIETQRDVLETQRDVAEGKKRTHFDVSLCEKASLRSPKKKKLEKGFDFQY